MNVPETWSLSHQRSLEEPALARCFDLTKQIPTAKSRIHTHRRKEYSLGQLAIFCLQAIFPNSPLTILQVSQSSSLVGARLLQLDALRSNQAWGWARIPNRHITNNKNTQVDTDGTNGLIPSPSPADLGEGPFMGSTYTCAVWNSPPGGLGHLVYPVASPRWSHLMLPHTQTHTHTHTSGSFSQPPDLMNFPTASVDPCPFSSHPTDVLVSRASPDSWFSPPSVPSLNIPQCGLCPSTLGPFRCMWGWAFNHTPWQNPPIFWVWSASTPLVPMKSIPRRVAPWATNAPEEQPESIFSVGCIRGITHFKLKSECQGMIGL